MELVELKDQYHGRIFLCGNGPSMNLLTEEEKEFLKGEVTFSGSRWFMWPQHWATDFYILTERKQADQWKERGFQNATAKIAKFFVTWQPAPKGWVPVPKPPSNAHDVLNYGTNGLWGCAGADKKPHLHHGKDTPLAMAQVAHYMGFGQLYLIGCETEGPGRSYEDEPRGMHASGIMDDYYRRAGGELGIKDCTKGGRLSRVGALEYVSLESLM
jgi:hypothetical protein